MPMIRQHDPGVDMEWPRCPDIPHSGSEEFDRAGEQVIRVALEQVDGEEISPPCHAITPIVGHSPVPYEKPYQAASCRGFLTPIGSLNNVRIVSNARRKAPLVSSLSGTRLNS